MKGPHVPPPYGISLPIRWKRVIDGDTLEVILPSGRTSRIRVEGFDAPELAAELGMEAKHALESLLEGSDGELTAFIPLPEDKDESETLDIDELLSAFSFERLRAYLFIGSIRIDLWMIDHGHVKIS